MLGRQSSERLGLNRLYLSVDLRFWRVIASGGGCLIHRHHTHDRKSIISLCNTLLRLYIDLVAPLQYLRRFPFSNVDELCGKHSPEDLFTAYSRTMSEPIPESIPTSQDPRSQRPLKKRALTPNTQQASQVEALFAKPDRDIIVPDGTISKKYQLAPPPEIVANVQGSSAGAGSGEFHVYKASRRREYERIKSMEEEVVREKADEEFEKKREEMKKKDEEKTGKNRRRREKSKTKKKGDGKGKVENSGTDGQQVEANDPSKGLQMGEVGAEQTSASTVEDVGVIIHDDD